MDDERSITILGVIDVQGTVACRKCARRSGIDTNGAVPDGVLLIYAFELEDDDTYDMKCDVCHRSLRSGVRVSE